MGGSTPEALLGHRYPEDAVLVRGGDKTGFWARRDDQRVQGYVWGKLTSGSRFQPLWVVLLPFTLVNVAGWMHRPAGPSARRGVRWSRWLVTALGFTLTVTWVIWLCVILADLVAYRAGRDLSAPATAVVVAMAAGGVVVAAIGVAWRVWWPLIAVGGALVVTALVLLTLDSAGMRGTWGVAAAGLAMVGIFFIAERSRRRFEESPETQVVDARRRLDDDEGLDSPDFFAHAGDSEWLFKRHALLAAVTLLVAVAWVWKRVVADDAGTLAFGSLFVVVGTVQFVLLVTLVAVSLGEWDRLSSGWRVAGPAVAATTGLMLTNGVFGGLALWLSQRLDGARVPAELGTGTTVVIPLGAELALLDVFVGTLLVLVAGLVLAWLPYFLQPKFADAPDVPERWRGAVARRRRLARAPRHLDIPISAWALLLLVAGALFAILRVEPLEGCDGVCLSLAADRLDWPPLRAVGAWVLPFAALGFSALVRLGARSAKARGRIGNVWDVLTFWPRRFHPLAVRPYAERAVPELQRYLEQQEGPVVVSAHSQGAVLAFAALYGLRDRLKLRHMALVTYGAPLDRLHGRFFPHYFAPDDFLALRGGLFDGQSGWRNFYRLTDHVGQAVFGRLPEAAGSDRVLSDPAMTQPVDDPDEPPLERDLDPGRAIAGHSHYRRERQIKSWVQEVKGQLGAG